MPIIEIVKTNKFGFLYLLAVCHLFYGYYINNSYKTFGYVGGIDDRTLTTIGSFAALFNGCFKIFWASLLDYYPFKPIYGIIVFIQLSMLIWVHWAVYSSWQYFIVICLSFMCDGSITSMLPAVTLSVFGLIRGNQVYGYMYSVFGCASMLGAFAVTMWQQSLGYQGMLVICFFFSLSAGINAMFYDFTRVSYREIALSKGIDYSYDISDTDVTELMTKAKQEEER